MPRGKDDHSVPSFAMPEELYQKLDVFCRENGLSRTAALNEAVKMLLVDRIKSALPDRAGDIDDFEMYIGKIMEGYRRSLEMAANATDLARREVKGQLDGMAVLSETNRNLQDQIQKLTALCAEQRQQLDQQDMQIKALQKQAAAEEDLVQLKAQYASVTQQLADANLQIAQLKAAHADELTALQKKQFDEIIEVIRASK